MSSSKDWLQEVQVYSSNLTTGERIISKCKIEYAWNPSKCSHCKVYVHKDINCGILIAKQMKKEEERSKIEKGKEGATVDLMQVLLASTKEVKEQNDGFVDVVKKTKGNNGFFFSKEATGEKNSFQVRGIKGISRKMKVQGFLLETASRGKKGIIRKLEILGLLLEFAIRGIMGIIRKIWNFVLIEVGRQEGECWKSNKVMGKNKDGGDVSEVKGFVGNNSMSRPDQEAKKSEAGVNFNGSRQGYIPKSGAAFKISSNFDLVNHSMMGHDAENFLSTNKFETLKNLEDENKFVFSKGGVDEDDLAYLDSVNQMDVIGSVPVFDTKMEAGANDI
ncbi:unnamed protein product [Lactuca saligna]|uniref:Uncharacterized protein n=1 Tax=Lactuca saligna TaxID=75948 RepID=A0AA36E361_LACSI|nr:unnamed protein product [Lactuca saligna]